MERREAGGSEDIQRPAALQAPKAGHLLRDHWGEEDHVSDPDQVGHQLPPPRVRQDQENDRYGDQGHDQEGQGHLG